MVALNKFLNSVSLGPRLVVPDTVEGTRDLLVRVDIRDLGWEQYQWDVLAGVYPYGVDPHSDATLSALTKETHTVLPIIRADWFTANASQPAIYHALRNLPETIRELEHRLGVDVAAIDVPVNVDAATSPVLPLTAVPRGFRPTTAWLNVMTFRKGGIIGSPMTLLAVLASSLCATSRMDRQKTSHWHLA